MIEASYGTRAPGLLPPDAPPPVQPGVERIDGPDPVDRIRGELIAGAAGVRQIIGLLRSGATDEMAARTGRVSERTVRRRIASVMTLLGASGWFEARVRAAQSGWV